MTAQPDQRQYTCGYSFSPPSSISGALARYRRVRGRRGGGEGECPRHAGSGAIRKPKTCEGICGGSAQAASTASQICGIRNCGGQRTERSNWPFLLWGTHAIPLIVRTA